MKKTITILLLCIGAQIFAQDGVLDTSFGTNGNVLFNNVSVDFNSVQQSDGKIFYREGYEIHRLNQDGTPDLTFGTSGYVTINQPGITSYYEFLVLNNKVYVFTNTSIQSPPTENYYMGRYNFDGAFDTTLGGGLGWVIINAGDIKSGLATKLTSDNKILLGGNSTSSTGSLNNIYTRRYDLNGVPDYSFNSTLTSGGVNLGTSSIGLNTSDGISRINVLSSGEVVLSVYATYYGLAAAPEKRGAGLVLATPNVTVPSVLMANYESYYGFAKSDSAIDANDNIYLLTGSNINVNSLPAPVNIIYKRNAAGDIDTTFGINGSLNVSLYKYIENVGIITGDFSKIAIQPDGKILLAGEALYTNYFGYPGIILARYLTDGTLDTTFGNGGYVIHDILHPTTPVDHNTLKKIFLSQDGSAVYMCGSNYENSIILKYNNPSLGTTTFDKEIIKLYPNPVKDILNLSFDKEITTATIYNLLGQEVITKAINANQGNIDVSSLTSGTYFVKVYADTLVKTLKIIKE